MSSCELCMPKHPAEFWRSRWFYAIDAGTEDFPCFLRLISTRHVPEMSDLPPEERRYLWRLLEAMEEAMIEVVQPDKVNYAQFGNMCPHLHWHLIARWHDDSHFPECPWGPKQRPTPAATAERRARAERLMAVLPALLDRVEQPKS